jgi:hypothetical protein
MNGLYFALALIVLLAGGTAGVFKGPARYTLRVLAVLRGLLRPHRGQHSGGRKTSPGSCPYEICHHNHPELPPWGEAGQPDGAPAEDDDSISPADFTRFDIPPGRLRPYARPDDPEGP